MMNSQRLRSLKPRTKLYAAVVIAFIVAVCVRIWLVQLDRGRTIVSFVGEWALKGKPVTVEQAIPKDVPVFTKLSLRCGEGGLASGYVTADIKDKLAAGQEVFLNTDGQPCGTLSVVGTDLDIDTGMFPVEARLNEPLPGGTVAVVFAHTGTLSQVIAVPNEILDFTGNEYYLWKIENSKAKRVRVTIGSRNGYGTVITGGIQSGDSIVYEGRAMLSENDTVRSVAKDAQRYLQTKGRSL